MHIHKYKPHIHYHTHKNTHICIYMNTDHRYMAIHIKTYYYTYKKDKKSEKQREHHKDLKTLVEKVCWIKYGGSSAMGPMQSIPALLTRMSMRPWSRSASATAASREASELTSSVRRVIFLGGEMASPDSFGSKSAAAASRPDIDSRVRAVAMTWQPARENARAKAWPSPPEEHPVIRTTWSFPGLQEEDNAAPIDLHKEYSEDLAYNCSCMQV